MNNNRQDEMIKMYKKNQNYLKNKYKHEKRNVVIQKISWISGIVLLISIAMLDSISWVPTIVAVVSAMILFLSLLLAGKLDF